MTKLTIFMHVVTIINQFQRKYANLFLLIEPLTSALLTAVILIRAISAVLQPIAVLGVVVAGPVTARPLSARRIVCKKERKNYKP